MSFKQGRDLVAGERVSLVSGANGIATLDAASVTYLVTNVPNKQGPVLVNINDGTSVIASPLSVWATE